MIAAWMPYAVVVSTVFGLAGMALERGLRLARLPARWSVAAAMLGSILVPALTREAPANESGRSAVLVDVIAAASPHLSISPSPTDLGVLDLPLAVLWIVGATLTLLVVVGTQVKVARDAGCYREDVVQGVRVRRTEAFGPATVGAMRSVIVLPRWVDDLDAGSQRVVVRHEQEHVCARDPQLLFAALILTALQPWNVALWWQFLRLRNAIELDCDQRLLCAGVPLRPYGGLLLRLASRREASLTTALTFAASRAFVRRRIRTMVHHATGTRYLAAIAAACVAAALAVVGCQTPSPLASEGPDESAPTMAAPAANASGFEARTPGVEYAVTTEGVEEVLAYLRDARVGEVLVNGTDPETRLRPIIDDLLSRGVVRAVPSSREPLNVFFEDASGAPQGLMRVWVENDVRRVQLFKAITVREGE